MSNIKLFEEKKVRSVYNEQVEKWYFSVIDVIQVLTDSTILKRYLAIYKRDYLKKGVKRTIKSYT